MANISTTTGPTGHVVPHHFKNAEDAFESSKLGLWVFLVTEVLLFSVLFLGYIVFRTTYPEAFHESSHHLDWKLGGINTLILICSSFSMAMAVEMTKENKRGAAVALLLVTLACAGGFMGIKSVEYRSKYEHGLMPFTISQTVSNPAKPSEPAKVVKTDLFTNKEIKHPQSRLFFSLYFMMTGIHGIHVLVGMGLITWVLVKTARGKLGADFYTHTELTGLYWHLVDLVWIFLFPLLYLVG